MAALKDYAWMEATMVSGVKERRSRAQFWESLDEQLARQVTSAALAQALERSKQFSTSEAHRARTVLAAEIARRSEVQHSQLLLIGKATLGIAAVSAIAAIIAIFA